MSNAKQKDILDRKFIFIGGLHRSGTSIVHRCLREHPLISGFKDTPSIEDEGQHLQSVYLAAKHFGGVGQFACNPNARLTENSNLVSEANRLRLFENWQPYWNLNKLYLMEKSPPNLIRMRFLQALFPNSYFIILIRHPIAVSYATKVWRSDLSLLSLFNHWSVAHKTLCEDKAFIKNILLINYEDFADNTEACLWKIYDFLDIEPFRPSEIVKRGTNDKYFLRWSKNKNFILRKCVNWKYKSEFRNFGYSLT